MKAFDIYGVIVTVESDLFPNVLNRLEFDLKYFVISNVSLEPHLKIVAVAYSEAKSGVVAFEGQSYRAYGWILPRTVIYDDGSCIKFFKNGIGKTVEILSKDEDRVYELSFLLLQSLVGEKLESSGWLRLHALSFKEKRAGIVLLPSSGGKSTLAYMMAHLNWKVYSDELTLVKAGNLYPFPWRMAFDERSQQYLGIEGGAYFQRRGGKNKSLVPFNLDVVPTPDKLVSIYWGVISNKNQIRDASFREKIQFAISVFRGVGLTQMIECAIRLDNFWVLTKIAFLRIGWIFRTIGKVKVFEINREFAEGVSALKAHQNSLSNENRRLSSPVSETFDDL